MRKIILVSLLILCSAHFNTMAEGNEDEEAKLLDWGILLDVGYGFGILNQGMGFGLSYFNDHNLISARFTGARFNTGSRDWYPSYDTYEEGGLLYGYLSSNRVFTGSASVGVGLIYKYGENGGLALGIPFELNGLVQLFRYVAVGIKVYGHISSNSFVGSLLTLRLGAVTE